MSGWGWTTTSRPTSRVAPLYAQTSSMARLKSQNPSGLRIFDDPATMPTLMSRDARTTLNGSLSHRGRKAPPGVRMHPPRSVFGKGALALDSVLGRRPARPKTWISAASMTRMGRARTFKPPPPPPSQAIATRLRFEVDGGRSSLTFSLSWRASSGILPGIEDRHRWEQR